MKAESQLPIYEIEESIISSLKQSNRLIIQAPTGSGKSTQIPKILLKHGLLEEGLAVILQPRRLATRMLAARVASELRAPLGELVGYQIRLDHQFSRATRIKFVTEGILLRQMIHEPRLPGVSALIFDEFHERHLYGDVCLGRALDIQEKLRPDLKIIVMSATLDRGLLEGYLKTATALTSTGRTFPVEIDYRAPKTSNSANPIWEEAAEAFEDYCARDATGDTLIFMPGSYEIHKTIEALRASSAARGQILLPLHGELPVADQDAAVAGYEKPKVVVATNVAETSLTIQGITTVIDSGLARIPKYDPRRGINTLLIEKISQASADQRAGRAGRTAPGKCIRLWSRRDHEDRSQQELPEILRLELSEVVLSLKASGIGDLRSFRWIEPPSEHGLRDAEALLTDLGALDSEGAITEIGHKMLQFPVHPRYARMLLAAKEYQCVYQVCLIAALTQGRDLLIRNPGREVEEFRDDVMGTGAPSDFWYLMRAWQYASKNNFKLEACRRAGIHAATARQVGPLLDQFLRICEKENFDVKPRPVPDEQLQKCILIGFSDRVAKKLDSGTLRCELVHGRRGTLVRESVVRDAPLLVSAEIREVESSDRNLNTLLSLATAIKPEWLEELFPGDIQATTGVDYDPSSRRVIAEMQKRFRGLALDGKRVEPPPADEAAKLLAQEVLEGRLVLTRWDHEVEQWIERLNQLSTWCPELALPPMSDEDRAVLIEQICHGSFSYKDIKEKEIKPVVKSWLSHAQQELLEKHAPERIPLPNGKKGKVTYSRESMPYLAVKIQDLYGMTQTPRIAMNRVALIVHILGPNMRPVQITQDLAGFWKEHYPRIKQELQRKYPKHEWK